MICNQLQNRSGFFVCMTLAMMEITQNSLAVNLTGSLAEQYCCLKKVVFIHWKLKKPDKGSRNSTAFVRLFV